MPNTQKCPICLADNAKYKILSGTHDYYFNCESCKKSFVVDGPAYEALLNYKQDVKEENIKNFSDISDDYVWRFYIPSVERKEGIIFPGIEAIPFLKKNLRY